LRISSQLHKLLRERFKEGLIFHILLIETSYPALQHRKRGGGGNFPIFVLASIANWQTNRDSPFLGSKLSRTVDESIINKGLQNTTCNQVSFLLTVTPSTQRLHRISSVKVSVLENCIATPGVVADPTRIMLVSGGSVHEIVGFSNVARQLARVLTK
jgi:hypothetical protein